MAVRVELGGVAGVVPAPVRAEALGGLLRGLVVAGEPHQGAGGDVDRHAAQLAHGGGLVVVRGEHGARPARQRHAHGARAHVLTQRVVPRVDDEHPVLGLAVLVAHLDAELLGRPLDHLGGERLTGGRGSAERDVGRRDVPLGPHGAVHGRRGREVGDVEVLQDRERQLRAVAGVQQQAPTADRQRAEDAVVEAVRPARVGTVPEHVVGPHVQARLDVLVERGQGAHRHDDALRGAGGAGGEQHDQAGVRTGDRRGEAGLLGGGDRGQVEVAVSGLGAVRQAGDDHRDGDALELSALVRVGDDHLGVATGETHLDGRPRERGEQRHVDGTESPDPHEGEHQVRGLGHQRGHPVALAHAELGQRRGDLLALGPQLAVGDVPPGQVGVDDGEGDRLGGVAVAQELRGARTGDVVDFQQLLRRQGRGRGVLGHTARLWRT